jgi:hypothetical protein
MKTQTYNGTIIGTSDIEITDEQYKELANRYTRALAESMANTKLAVAQSIFKGDFRDVDKPWEVEVDFNE